MSYFRKKSFFSHSFQDIELFAAFISLWVFLSVQKRWLSLSGFMTSMDEILRGNSFMISKYNGYLISLIRKARKTNKWEDQIWIRSYCDLEIWIFTAAHCFWDTKGSKVLDKAPYKLATGKYHRDWYIEDSETQKRDVLEFFVHKRFKGHKLNLAYDIAMIKTTEPFVLTWAINVICVDWQLDLEDEHLSKGNNGTVRHAIR